MHANPKKRRPAGRLHIGTFEDPSDLLDAVRAFRARGVEVVDAISPYPVHGLDEAMGLRPSRLPYVCFIGGALGLTLGLWFQYWSTWTSWPLDVGGRPFDSLPAFIVVAFETTILLAGLATAGALLLRCGLWPGRGPRPGMEITTDDKLLLIVAENDASLRPGEHAELLERHGARNVRQEVRA
jgi:ActD protein